MKRQTSEWEKIIANEATDKELISKIYKQLMQLNTRKINAQSENGQKNSIDISPKKTYRWPRGTWKDVQCCLREIKIKTTMRYHLVPVRMAILKRICKQ